MPSVQNFPSRRLHGLDAARAVAVLAMVMGHSLDAILSDTARATPGMVLYWQFRAFTAPLFLLVSGWAVMTSVTRLNLSGWALWKRYLPRVALLFFLGFFLRLPLWNLEGFLHFDRQVWQHFLAFDALHAIASSLLVGIAVVAIFPRGWMRVAALVGLAVIIPWMSETVWQLGAQPQAAFWVREAFAGGGISPFTLFPWAGFFFIGAVVGLSMNALDSTRSKVVWLLGLACAAMVVTGKTPVLEMAPAGMMLFSWRLGVPFLILAGCLLLPERVAKLLAPVGRASLWVYVIHLPIAYGWGYWPGLDARVGHTLDILPALGVASMVALFSVTAALASKQLKLKVLGKKSMAFAEDSLKDMKPLRSMVG